MIEFVIIMFAFFVGFVVYKESKEEFPALNSGLDVIEKLILFAIILMLLFELLFSFQTFRVIFDLVIISFLILLLKKQNFLLWFIASFIIVLTSSSQEDYLLLFPLLILYSMIIGRKYKNLK
ncbi:MAG: hypothetical protein PWP03_667 [Candidatus Woesearchaeota archaeon]|nr:hypothetical protein [Candidatus Woesearchaeota archaeon]MDN5328029.1 hypothetical protein [Candidatus Woesearchaeota archaeon]